MTELMTCQSKELLVAYLYEETTAEEQRIVEAHLTDCAECRTELDGMTNVRGTLASWDAPPLASHFRVVPTETAAASWRRWWVAGPMAAAAVLVLATHRADVNGVVRRHLGVRKISFAPHDDAVTLTGMEFGGITPVGLPAGWPILVDGAVVAAGDVVIGSGIRGSKLLVGGAALAELPGELSRLSAA